MFIDTEGIVQITYYTVYYSTQNSLTKFMLAEVCINGIDSIFWNQHPRREHKPGSDIKIWFTCDDI